MKLGTLSLAAMIAALGLLGCQGSDEVPESAPATVAYRGPDVSIDVRPAGRAERFAALKPSVAVEPTPVRRRRHRKATVTVAKPKPQMKPKVHRSEPLPPDEEFFPTPKPTESEDFDPGLYRVPEGE